MSNTKFSNSDWSEIFYALELKTIAVESGNYDDFPGEVDVRGSVTQQWATHLRRIMAKIGVED